ncbi:MAG: STAS domain-containing protein [Planctomycetes bacterium]|nr:STAS domain-containing protein [Planctomycetota bacterium]
MSIATTPSQDGRSLTIKVSGRFDFKLHTEFRRAYESLPQRPAQYIIDLGETEYMDSSALGMLLLLRQFAGGDGSTITLAKVRPEVAKILAVASFGKLFKVA